MDSMSYRNNRPSQGRGERPERSEAAPAATVQPQPEPANVAAPARPRTSHVPAKPKRPKRLVVIVGLIIIIALITAAVWFVNGRTATATAIDGSKYQAVFFTNGQVYFGKLSPLNGDYMQLKNVYYLQNKTKTSDDSSPQSASKQNASDVELIKLGNEIHGPEDEMLVAKDQILFFENLKPAGTVSQTITNFQNKNKQ